LQPSFIRDIPYLGSLKVNDERFKRKNMLTGGLYAYQTQTCRNYSLGMAFQKRGPLVWSGHMHHRVMTDSIPYFGKHGNRKQEAWICRVDQHPLPQ